MSARILIVDDEANIRTVMRLALEASGYEVDETTSGEEALERYAAAPRWDLVLLDERMPGIDGIETLRRLRGDDPDAVVIMVTAFASIELAVEAMKLGATDFVRKPMTPDTLRAAVHGALAKARGEWPPASGARDAAAEKHYEVWMTNGFRLRHVAEGATPLEQRFEVLRANTPGGQPVAVSFDASVAHEVAAYPGRALAGDHAFWRRQAALALTHYVWTHAEAPPYGRLVIHEATQDLLAAARRIV